MSRKKKEGKVNELDASTTQLSSSNVSPQAIHPSRG